MPSLIILTPTRDRLTDETSVAIEQNLDGIPHVHLVEVGLPVVEARNRLWVRAEAVSREHPDWLVLHVDDDAYWPSGTIASFVDQMSHLSVEGVLSGFYSERFPTYLPPGVSIPELYRVETMGGTCFMHRASLFDVLEPRPWDLLEGVSFEDQSFSRRLAVAGVPIYVYTRNPIWHIDRRDGFAYAKFQEPHYVRSNKLVPTGRISDLPYDIHSYGLRADFKNLKAEEQERIVAEFAEGQRMQRETLRLRDEAQRLNAETDRLRTENHASDDRIAHGLVRLLLGPRFDEQAR